VKLQSLLILSLFLLLGKAWAQPGTTNFAQTTELAFKAVYNKDFAEAAKKMAEIEKMCMATQSQTQYFELYLLRGEYYHEFGDAAKSKEAFLQAIKIANRIKNTELLIRAENQLANILIHIGNYPEAQTYFLKVAELQKQQNNLKKYAIALSNYGNLFRRINQSHKALKPLLEAHKIQKEIRDDWSLITTNRFLGMYFSENKDYKNAEKYILESLDFAEKSQSKSDINKAYLVLQRNYYLAGDAQNGDKYQKLYLRNQDALNVEDKVKAVADFEVKYKTADKERMLVKSQLENAQKQKSIIALSLAVFGITAITFLYLKISKAKETERLKNLEIESQNRLILAREIERQRIAKELHDSVGSQLTVVSTSLDNAFYLFENQKLKPEKLENISGEVRLAAQSLRDTIWATYNSEITVLDLKSRIQEFIKKFADENFFKLEMQINGDNTILNPIEGLNLFRIVQESLNNIQKYAKASFVKIEGSFAAGDYNLQISDNGIGFDLRKANTGNSYGLSNMKSRAKEIGGELRILSGSEGTVVEFSKKA
jgi:signal transduction histidine kinase